MKHQGSPIPWQAAFLVAALSCASPQAPGVPAAAGDDASLPPAFPTYPVREAVPGNTSFAALGSVPITQAAMVYPKTADEQAPPLSLTASDGTGLRLVTLDARAVVEGPLAFTELRLRFENPVDRVIEGRFSITLPTGAAISRLAMRLDTGWQEAEVVELQQARRAYEDFLHRRQDPALLEKEAGNEFRARIFPIPARGHKDIIISYSQSLAGTGATYRLPLRGLPAIDDLRVSLMLGQAAGQDAALTYRPVTLARRQAIPDQDFVVELPDALTGLHSGNLVVARVRPEVQTEGRAIGHMTILFDTSASRAPGFAGQVERLGSLVAALVAAHGPDMPLAVAAFDQSVAEIYRGPIGGFGAAHLDALLARQPLGASDLHAAFAWAGRAAGRPGSRTVVISDAIATLGPVEGDALRAAVAGMEGTVERLDFLLAGGIRDAELAARLARGILPRDGVILDMDQPAAELARRLGQTTVSGIRVAIDGAAWVWPHTLDGVQPGDEVLVFAELGPARGPARGARAPREPLGITLSGPVQQTLRVPLAQAARPLLERATVAARIAMLAARRDALTGPGAAAERSALVSEIIALSTRHRVLSDYTGLLVLETEADYVRFGIDRRALADILTVGERGIELVQRQGPVVLIARDEPTSGKPASGRDAEKKEARKAGARAPASVPAGGPADGPGADMDDDPGAADMKDEGASGGFGRGGGGRADAPPPPPAPVPAPAEEAMGGVEGGVAGGVLGGVLGGVAGEREAPAEPRPEPSRADDGRTRRRAAPASPQAEIAASADGRAAPAQSRPVPALPQGPPPYTGKLAEIMAILAGGARADAERAVALALAWRGEDPGDVMALVALGEALEALGEHALAARAYGSIIDLFPSRADMRRFAGERLERLGAAGAGVAADTYARAVAQRPDHLTGHRLLAYALLRQGRHADAFDAVLAGLAREYPEGRFRGGKRILREDLGLIAAAWIHHAPDQSAAIEARLRSAGAALATEPSLRFVLNWETDANDVDFHIHDGQGGHAYYSNKVLPSGGELYEDVTTGYGPECFSIQGPARAYPYRLRIHYYSRGPMGYGMGKLEIVEHDGRGNLRFEQRPFIVMNDGAYVDLGVVDGVALAR